MTHRRQIGTLLLVGGLLAHGPAGATTTLAERCAASELKAVGKLASASLACHAKEFPPEPGDALQLCLAQATAVFVKEYPPEPVFAAAPAGCTTTVPATDVETEVSSVVNAAVAEITGTPEDALLTTPAALACAAAKLKATGKAAKAQLACAATGAKHATVFASACVERTGAALVKAWGKAEGAGGCATVGDNMALNINGLLQWGGTHLPLPFPSNPVTCGTFVSAFGWGVADGQNAFETCTSNCQAGSEGTGNGQFFRPAAVAVDGSGNVFVADLLNSRIQEFDNTGSKFLKAWGSFGTGDGQFEFPSGVAVDGSGNVFVADALNARIQKFDNTGTFRIMFGWGVKDNAPKFETCTSGCQVGLVGNGGGQFNDPLDVAVDSSGSPWVADTENNRIQLFENANGFSGPYAFFTAFGSFGAGEGQFDAPLALAVDGHASSFVADANNSRIEKFSNTFMLLTAWRSFGAGDGQLNSPTGVAVDGSGNVFVIDSNNRILVFTNTGVFLTTWGSPGSGTGQFNMPGGVAVDGSGNVFVVDTFNNRIEKFACPIPPPPCLGISQSCSSNGQCCSNFCQGQALVCDCFATGDDCRQGPQSCCSGVCDTQTGLCL
jgi:sugar lactone lactonase YvrE